MTIYVSSLAVMIIGLLMYVLLRPENAKGIEVGRIMFAFGLLAFLLQGGVQHLVSVIR